MIIVKLDPDELLTLRTIHDHPELSALDLRERGCTRLQALAYFGYIHHRNGGYVVTKRGRQYLATLDGERMTRPAPARAAQLPLFDVDEPDENHPSKRLSRAEYLQRAWDKSGLLFECEIVFRPHKGWYAEPDEGRFFNDEGEYLGDTWRDAAEAISWITSGASHEHPDY